MAEEVEREHAVAAGGERLRERLVHTLAQQQSVQEHDDSGTIPVIGVRQRSAFVAERPHLQPFCMSSVPTPSDHALPVGSSAAHRRFPRAALLRVASDERLVELVRGGSEAAFEAIYDRHHRGILAFCRHMLASPEEGEDALQHTFMAAYRHLVDGSAEIQLRPWLYAIARNRCLTMLRARRERPLADHEAPATEHLSTEAQRRQDVRDLLGDVARLPEDQRAALVLAELGAVSHDEIALVLNVPRQKVKALVFQARTSLAASRKARETPCEEIREQVANLRGGALRRTTLHRHLRECAGCRAFRDEVALQRKTLAVALPVIPTRRAQGGRAGRRVRLRLGRWRGGGRLRVGRAGGQGAGDGGAGGRRDDRRRRGHTPCRPTPTRGGEQRASGFGARRGGVDAVRSPRPRPPRSGPPGRAGPSRRGGPASRGQRRARPARPSPRTCPRRPLRVSAKADKPPKPKTDPPGQAKPQKMPPGQAKKADAGREAAQAGQGGEDAAGPGQAGRSRREAGQAGEAGQGGEPPAGPGQEGAAARGSRRRSSRRARPRSSSRSRRRVARVRFPAVPTIRPMRDEDARAVHDVSVVTFTDLEARFHHPPSPPPPPDAPLVRFSHLIETDPGGAWVAEEDGRVIGAALAIDREGVWGLSLLVVLPDHQSSGIGRALLERTLEYAGGGRRGAIILASPDHRALRAYARAGFEMHPCMDAQGRPNVKRAAARRPRRRRARPPAHRGRRPRGPRRRRTAATSRRSCAPGGGCSSCPSAATRCSAPRASTCSPRSTRTRPATSCSPRLAAVPDGQGLPRRVDHLRAAVGGAAGARRGARPEARRSGVRPRRRRAVHALPPQRRVPVAATVSGL